MNQVTLSWVNIKFHLRSMNFRTFRWDCHLYRTHWTNGVPNKSAMTRLINDGTSGQSFAKISSPTLLVYTWNLHEALLNILNKEKLILTVSPAWNTIMKFTIYNIQLLEKLELFLLLSPPNFSSSPYSHSSLSFLLVPLSQHHSPQSPHSSTFKRCCLLQGLPKLSSCY